MRFPGALRDTLVSALLDAWALVSPVECAGCGEPDRALCSACLGALTPRPVSHSLPDGTVLFSALDYEGVPRRVLLSFKEQGRTDVAGPLSSALAAALAAAVDATAGVETLAVPTSRASFGRRGFDPVAVLLRRAGHRGARGLVLVRATGRQKTLDVEARAANASGSMRAKRRLDGRRFVIVDDVATSGATLVEAARAARQAGATVVAAATVGHTPRRLPRHGDRALNAR